jgi:hypothetical protein
MVKRQTIQPELRTSPHSATLLMGQDGMRFVFKKKRPQAASVRFATQLPDDLAEVAHILGNHPLRFSTREDVSCFTSLCCSDLVMFLTLPEWLPGDATQEAGCFNVYLGGCNPGEFSHSLM